MSNKIKVLIAEDMEPIRKRYVNVLNSDPNIEVIGDVATGSTACELAFSLKPDVILMDIEMESKDAGIRATGQILSKLPNVKIILLTVYEEDEMIFSAFQLGACDYILKISKNEDIINGVIGAYHNQSPIRPEIASKIRNEFKRVKTYESSFLFMLNILSTLTPRELDTLNLLINGHTKKEVCELRCVEMSTVKSQVHSILKKFKKRNISDIITTEMDRSLLETILHNYYNK
ncbi:response regulator transcription factor [Kineothrix sedimenti]|uniref:Stage 0 sporulation protein A homolog n=1 Tax=Kineothrix sedimenti TaxID=3123317 RepID=A0ABZ3EST1_9FIRM